MTDKYRKCKKCGFDTIILTTKYTARYNEETEDFEIVTGEGDDHECMKCGNIDPWEDYPES